jgi:hypothetical protein
MAGDELRRALERLQPAAPASDPAASAQGAAQDDPRSFLLRVMNDAGVDMHLRIEAAKALLLSPQGQRP